MQTKYKLGFNTITITITMIEGIKLLLFLLTRKGLIHIVAKHEREQMKKKKKNPNCGGGGVWCVHA